MQRYAFLTGSIWSLRMWSLRIWPLWIWSLKIVGTVLDWGLVSAWNFVPWHRVIWSWARKWNIKSIWCECDWLKHVEYCQQRRLSRGYFGFYCWCLICKEYRLEWFLLWEEWQSKMMKTTRGCELLVAIEDGTNIDNEKKELNMTWISLKEIKQNHPIQVAEFTIAKGIAKLSLFPSG